MIVWIIEDAEVDADAAIAALSQLRENLEIFRDRTIRWGRPLLRVSGGPAELVQPLDCMPDVVVLDLFDENGHFAAGQFYKLLRKHEIDYELQRSHVVAWSVKSGNEDARRFLAEEPRRDRRLATTDTKHPSQLAEKVASCIRNWKASRHS